MDDRMTKAQLVEQLRTARAGFDAAIAQVPRERMTEPGAAGDWNVKDVVAHLAYYERWYADRLSEALRGEAYTPTPLDMMHWDERNPIVYERERDRHLDEVMADSRRAFDDLVAAVEAAPEEFLTQPQTFEGAPGPVLIWQMIRGDVYDHYPKHIASIREWLSGTRA